MRHGCVFGEIAAPTPHRVVAQLVSRADREPVRLTRNGGLKKPMGLYFSAKSGRHLPWESRNELHEFWWAESRSEVVASWAQPHTLKMTVGGRSCRYTPDRLDELADGGVEIIEVKNAFDERKDPHYAAKLDQARLIYEGIGYRFRLVTKLDIEAEPGFSAAKLIQRHRSVALHADEMDTVEAVLQDHTVRFGDLLDALGGPPIALPKACALIVRRLVAVEVAGGLHRDSRVWAPNSSPSRPATIRGC